MKSYVITGATSFIGVHLVRSLLRTECRVYAVIRPKSLKRDRLPTEDDRFCIVETDMQEYDHLAELIPEKELQAFYHLAWDGVRAPYRDDEGIQEKNYWGAVKAADAAVKLNTKVFVGIGSQAEYGKHKGGVDEASPCCPVTEYGKAKCRACKTIQKMMEEAQIKFVWGRIFSAYGAYDYPGTLIMSLLKKMRDGSDIELTECSQMWDFIYVEDIADILARFGREACESGIYNIASGRPRRLKSFVEEMYQIAGAKCQIHFGAVPYGREGAVDLLPVVEKLKRNLGRCAETTFEEGIRKLIASEEENEKDKCVSSHL